MPNVTYSLDTLPPVDTDSLEKLSLLNDEDIDFSDIPLLSSDKLQEFALLTIQTRTCISLLKWIYMQKSMLIFCYGLKVLEKVIKQE